MRSARRVRHLAAALLVGAAGMLALPTIAAAAPPANDNFADAITIGDSGGVVSGTTLDATGETGEPNHYSSVQS